MLDPCKYKPTRRGREKACKEFTSTTRDSTLRGNGQQLRQTKFPFESDNLQ